MPHGLTLTESTSGARSLATSSMAVIGIIATASAAAGAATTALDAADKGNYEAQLYSWSGRSDPDGNTFSFLACKAALNYPKYCSPEADAALQAERGTVDPAKRKQFFSEFQRIVHADVPSVDMISPLEVIIANKKIRNYARGAEGLGDNFADVHFVD